MRPAGIITGLLALLSVLIPGTYLTKQELLAGRPGGSEPGSAASGESRPAEATLAGRVYDERGRPVAGATISLAGSGFWPARSVRADAEGRFHWPGIPAGIYEVRAYAGRSVAPALEGLILDAGAQRAFAFRLEPGWTLGGRVVHRETGRGIDRAEVTLVTGVLGLHSRRAETDAGGRFELPAVLGDDHALYVQAEGYVAEGPLRYREEESPITVRLAPAAAIEGRVVDARGRPVEGAVVALSAQEHGREPVIPAADRLGVTSGPVPPIAAAGAGLRPVTGRVATRSDGTFSVTSLRPGNYTLAVGHEDYAPAEVGPVHATAGSAQRLGDLVMRQGTALVGRVIDAEGRELEAIPVELRSDADRFPRLAVTGADGSFSFRVAAPGELSVTALPYDLPPARKTITIGDEALVAIELALSSSLHTLRGRVVDESGFGVGGALVTVSSNDPQTPVRRSTKSDSDGTFAVPALPLPPFSLRAEHPSFSPARLTEVDRLDEVRVVMSAGVTLLGEVLDDWTSEGLRNVTVSLKGPVEADSRTRADGSFVFDQIPPGVYQLSFSHPEYEAQEPRIVVEPPRFVDRPQSLEPVRLVPGGTIEGEVLDRYNHPVAGAEVAWGEPPRWDRSVWTDARGRFQLRGVPEGAIGVSARHPVGGQASSTESITVRPREASSGAWVRLPDSVRE
jgi:protocatechuate 3,4-dioxygenase beta subunit